VNRDAGLSLFCFPDPASRIESTAALYAPEFGKKIAIQKLEFHVEGAQSARSICLDRQGNEKESGLAGSASGWNSR
jgi:hypothetical protein